MTQSDVDTEFLNLWVISSMTNCGLEFQPTNPDSKQKFIDSCESLKLFSFCMAGFCFENGGRRAIRPILEKYQAGKVNSRIITYFHQYKSLFMPNIIILSIWYWPFKGESEGYTVKSKEKDFPISNYPLEQTEFYYAQKQGMGSVIRNSLIP